MAVNCCICVWVKIIVNQYQSCNGQAFLIELQLTLGFELN